MAAALWFKTFLLLMSLLLLLLLIIMPFSYGPVVVEGFQGGNGMQAEYSLEQGGNIGMIQMSSARKLLMQFGAMLDYDGTGANPKHDPRKKPGKP